MRSGRSWMKVGGAVLAGVAAVGAVIALAVTQPFKDPPTLSQLAMDGDIDALSARLADGANPNYLEPDGPPLLAAIDHSDVEVVKVLLAAGADPNLGDRDELPLHVALRDDRSEVVRSLLAAGADPNSRDEYGDVPFDMTSDCADWEALIRAGADLGAVDSSVVPLASIAFECDAKLVDVALQAGADPDARFESGPTTLMWMVTVPDPEKTERLLDAGADPNIACEFDAVDALGLIWGTMLYQPLTPTQLEAVLALTAMPSADRRKLVDGFRAAKADGWDDISTVYNDIEGLSPGANELGAFRPLFAAALSGQAEMVDRLLAAGADPNGTNGNGTATAAAIARVVGHDAIADRLEAAAARG